MAGMDYGASILRIVVAQMCETVGWNSIHSTPLELLTDVLKRYITEVAENTHRYAEQFGHTEPTLHDLGLAFKDMGITTVDLSEYVEYVATIPSQREVPKYPVERESHLNLLKPGSQEVVTRPVHIHEHLPAMHPELEDEDYGMKTAALAVDTTVAEAESPPLTSPKANPFKKPGDPVSLETPQTKRVRLTLEEEGRPLREISSVMMTTSGFLSPAREGKLPEARTPTPSIEFLTSQSSTSSPQTSICPSSYPTVPPEVKGEKKCKKKQFTEPVRKVDTSEAKEKDHLAPDTVTEDDDSKVKKLVGMKELSKLKALKSLKMMSHSNPNVLNNSLKPLPKIPKFRQNNATVGPNNVLSMTSKIKQFSSKSAKLIPDGLPLSSSIMSQKANPSDKIKSNNSNSGNATSVSIDGKLPSEPDKQKLNIFKKISKVKEDRSDHSENIASKDNAARESAASAGRLSSSISEVIESVVQRSMKESLELPSSSTITSPLPPITHSDSVYSDNDAFIYDSPPGTPRTSEVIMPPLKKSEAKKRKRDRAKDKKEKSLNFPLSPKIKCEPLENEITEKPKTPEIEHDSLPLHPTPSPVFPYFPTFPPAPGLIPPPISGLFPPKFNLDKHGALVPQHLTPPQLPPSLQTVPTIVPRLEPKLSITPIAPPIPPPFHPPVVISKKQSVTAPITPAPAPVPSIAPVPTPTPVQQPKTETVEKPVIIKEKEKDKEKEKTKEEKKKDKEHRKEKKDKIKKKKDKKDKMKNKDKSLKKKEKLRKEKAREKKERRREEKRREKERYFNCRLGELDQCIDDNIFTFSNLLPYRQSCDKIVNTVGKKLLDLMDEKLFILLNGRSKSYSSGNYTLINNNGKSTIDYIWVSTNSIDLVSDMIVSDFVLSSDHLPVIVETNLGVVTGRVDENIQSKERLNWCSDKKELYKLSMALSDRLENTSDDLNSDYCNLIVSIKHEANSLDMIKNFNGSIEFKNKPWYDLDCNNKNRLVRQAYRAAKKVNFTGECLEKYLTTKKLYRLLLRNKRNQYYTDMQKIISNIRSSNEFWKAVKFFKRKSPITNCIGSEVWVDFLINIYF